AIATKEVTVAEYDRFLKSKPEGVVDWRDHEQFKRFFSSADCPLGLVDWYDAGKYCNLLRARGDGPESQGWYSEQLRAGMKLPADYLSRTGYRLPTEAEWEYACRAGAVSSRPFGGPNAWLVEYGWYQQNSGVRRHPVGQLKPNDLGLFDILGNADEWCSD